MWQRQGRWDPVFQLQNLHRHLQATCGHCCSPLQLLDQEGHWSLVTPTSGLMSQIIWDTILHGWGQEGTRCASGDQ